MAIAAMIPSTVAMSVLILTLCNLPKVANWAFTGKVRLLILLFFF